MKITRTNLPYVLALSVVMVGVLLFAGMLYSAWQFKKGFEPRIEVQKDPFRATCTFGCNSEGAPPFSSRHFYYESGFTDLDCFWSFELPPDLARQFLNDHPTGRLLVSPNDRSKIRSCVKGRQIPEELRAEYWFNSFSDLDKVYYREFYFCGYSSEKNRIYLMNWND